MKYAARKTTDYIVIHCTATPEGRDIGAKEVDRMHRQRGFNGIGYHYVIRLDGTVEKGRPEDAIGAHVEGLNARSIGIAYVGGVDANDINKAEDTRTPQQKAALRALLTTLRARYPNAKIIGHRDHPGVKKACPCFDAIPEYADI